MLTELQEINDDLRIVDARIAFVEACTEDWRDKEVAQLRTRIDAFTEQIADIKRKHVDAPGDLVRLNRHKETLLRTKSISTDAEVRLLLRLQKELQGVDAS